MVTDQALFGGNNITISNTISSLIISFFLLAAPAYAQSTDTVHQAVFERVMGKVEIQFQGKGPWRVARVGTKIVTDDQIRTGANSSARIVISDIGAIEFAEQTEARFGSLRQIREASHVRDVVVIHLERGISKQSFRRWPNRTGDYKVATPIAVAGVRGTNFEMELDDQLKNLGCAVAEGTVQLNGTAQGQSWSRTLTAGRAIHVAADVVPADPVAADARHLRSLREVRPVPARELAPAGMRGDTETSSESSSLEVILAGNPTEVKLTFGGGAGDQEIKLAVGKDFAFKQTFSSIPVTLECSGKVIAYNGKAVIRFLVITAHYADGAPSEAHKIPCVISASPGPGPGVAETFLFKVSPDGAVEVE